MSGACPVAYIVLVPSLTGSFCIYFVMYSALITVVNTSVAAFPCPVQLAC